LKETTKFRKLRGAKKTWSVFSLCQEGNQDGGGVFQVARFGLDDFGRRGLRSLKEYECRGSKRIGVKCAHTNVNQRADVFKSLPAEDDQALEKPTIWWAGGNLGGGVGFLGGTELGKTGFSVGNLNSRRDGGYGEGLA